MRKVSLSSVQEYRNRIETLRLHSFERDLYLAEIEVDGEPLQVVGEDGSPASWRSQLAAKNAFKGLGITRARLRHQSSYDEMIGLGEAAEAMEVDIQNPDADYS